MATVTAVEEFIVREGQVSSRMTSAGCRVASPNASFQTTYDGLKVLKSVIDLTLEKARELGWTT